MRGGRLDHLADDDFGFARMLLEPRRQRLVEDVLDHGRTSEDTSLSLVCEENFGSGTFTSTAVRPSRQSSPVSAIFPVRVGLGIAVDLARQRAAEAGQMGAAVTLRDVVGEAQHVLVVAVVPPQRGLDADVVHLGPHHDRGRHHRLLVAVEIFDEFLDAAVIAHPRASTAWRMSDSTILTPEFRNASSRSDAPASGNHIRRW